MLNLVEGVLKELSTTNVCKKVDTRFANQEQPYKTYLYNWLKTSLKVPCVWALKVISGPKANSVPLPTVAENAAIPSFK
jgi:hypothetical protein